MAASKLCQKCNLQATDSALGVMYDFIAMSCLCIGIFKAGLNVSIDKYSVAVSCTYRVVFII